MDLETFIASAGRKAKAGQLVRLLNIPMRGQCASMSMPMVNTMPMLSKMHTSITMEWPGVSG
jgi:hypothetical protein